MNIHDPDVIIELHDALIDEFGGEKGLLNEHLLLSALARPFTGLADGTELYPSIEEKAAALMYSMIKNHPFLDGNKRTGAQVTHIFCKRTDILLNITLMKLYNLCWILQ